MTRPIRSSSQLRRACAGAAPPRTVRRIGAIALLLALFIAAPAGAIPYSSNHASVPATAAAPKPKPKVSATNIMPDFVCVTCHEPLNVAQSPQALEERAYMSSLVAKGETLPQIETAMVGQYGPGVLGVPKAKGFNAVLYILPPVLLLAGLASLAVLLPRWRRRARAAAAEAAPAGPPLDTADAMRLDEELARYKG